MTNQIIASLAGPIIVLFVIWMLVREFRADEDSAEEPPQGTNERMATEPDKAYPTMLRSGRLVGRVVRTLWFSLNLLTRMVWPTLTKIKGLPQILIIASLLGTLYFISSPYQRCHRVMMSEAPTNGAMDTRIKAFCLENTSW